MLQNELVEVRKKEIFTTSKIIAEKLGVIHKDLLRTIERLIKKNNDLGVQDSTSKFEQKFIKTEFEHGKTKIKYEGYLINEFAFSILIMQLGNYKKAYEMQILFAEAFFRMKKVLENQSNSSWIEKREQLKVTRREETDVIKEFVEYATNQGSKNANKYYIHITNMTNKALELLIQVEGGKPIRDLATISQFWIISSLDDRATKVIKSGMEQGLHYKEIYIYAKDEVNKLADMLDFKPKLEGKKNILY